MHSIITIPRCYENYSCCPPDTASSNSMLLEDYLRGALFWRNPTQQKWCRVWSFHDTTHSYVKEFTHTSKCKQIGYVCILASEQESVWDRYLWCSALVVCTACVKYLYICVMTMLKRNTLCYINIREEPTKWQMPLTISYWFMAVLKHVIKPLMRLYNRPKTQKHGNMNMNSSTTWIWN